MTFKHIPILLILVFITSCTKKPEVFRVSVIQGKEKKKILYEPKVSFTSITDSIYYYYSEDDYQKFATDILASPTVYKSDKFILKIILRTYGMANRSEYEFVLRSYSKDFKIIDSYNLGGNVGEVYCDAWIDSQLVIHTRCDNGTTTAATIDEYGNFILNE